MCVYIFILWLQYSVIHSIHRIRQKLRFKMFEATSLSTERQLMFTIIQNTGSAMVSASEPRKNRVLTREHYKIVIKK